VDYRIFCGEWCIGRIYEKHSSPEHLRWFWSLFCPSKPESLRISNQVPTLEIAKAEFEASWKQWKAWAKMDLPAFAPGWRRSPRPDGQVFQARSSLLPAVSTPPRLPRR
jgi:hypothetical protein